MVQRKFPDKLGIQDHGLKSEIRSGNLRPSFLQFQDSKNKGIDSKKKMKKSGSAKRIDSENHKLPNYMKSTSSSVARKEQSKVSTRSPPNSHVSSDMHAKSKVAKPLARPRTNGLKMKRTCIKTPGFKPGIALVKKCPKVVLSEDLDIARATCSSTLKDHKLPDYLVLNPGGTESEGKSVIKVCAYTYCSLNGHLHGPLPPLKSFVSAKRLMLKDQRNVQLGCLSPRRLRPARDDTKSDEKLVSDGDLGVPTVCSPTLEEPSEFFVDIYTAGENKISNTDFPPMVDGTDEIIAQDYEEVEDVADDDDIDFCEILDEDREETGSKDMYLDNIPEETPLPLLFQDETKLGDLSIWKDIAAESMPSIQHNEQDSESSEMDRETGPYSLYLDFDYESPSKEEKGNDLDGLQDENGMIHDGFIEESRYCICTFFDTDMSHDTYSEDSLYSDSLSCKDYCRSEVSFHDLDGLNSIKTSAATESPKEEPEANTDLSFEGNKIPDKIAHVDATKAPSNLMIEDESSFGCLKFECIQTDDGTPEIGKGEADLLKDVVLEMVTSGDKAISDTIIDVDLSVQTSSDEGLGIPVEANLKSLNPTEAEAIIGHQEDSSESPDKVSRGSWKSNLPLQDQLTSERIAIAITRCRRSIEESNEEGQFNPREPNFLPLEPEPEAEKVDLRHQELDEKKNAEEWMVDYALRQTVTKLGPARKKKVALLVEAFEKVMPITKCQHNQSHSSAFDHARKCLISLDF
ncbi:midasin [Dorcoceras hygrometricum]|uniref:Midasin n=1 Tax=Dorcoceras hygrometricum TaxID=472368 RepID=A0A2Z7CMW5_9LAMI|nr:midasin [Dorcoceras hygrometricum]